MEKYTWITTQDGSPTLWNNSLGEPYRSTRGAFTESLVVFVKPAIEFLQKNKFPQITVGEFGLGVGTNWYTFSALANFFEIPFNYFAVEQDIDPFNESFTRWGKEVNLLQDLASKVFGQEIILDLDAGLLPIIYPSLEDARVLDRAQVWFHDPFGFTVNPDGYSQNTLKKCSEMWADKFLGLSYACNSNFQRELRELKLSRVEALSVGQSPLKRERLEFER